MAHKILAAILIASLAVILLLSDREWALRNRPTVDNVADIPSGEGMILSDLNAIIYQGGVHIDHPPSKAMNLFYVLSAAGRLPTPPPTYERPRPQYGYSVREITFFGMPFGWYTDMGYVLYTDDRWALIEAQLTEPAEIEFRKEVGRDLAQGFFFPFWAHLWGWVYLAGMGMWGWLYHRAVVRRREELGLI